ncbi:MAG: BlaI/MecI/CopY family transcriptional regulator [Oscillospiraceae bacterium]|jgi:predicted transcriptional regulator|nr:BlaI/MecI/CopY family transcriptional regulator [Oscillospiraceae bacterium]
MGETIRRLPDAELEVMLVIWEADGPVNSQYVLERIGRRRSWQRGTLLTVLARLTEKGFLFCQKQYRNNLYSARVELETYRQSEGRAMFGKLYGNSFENLVASFYRGQVISKEDLSKLRAFLESAEEEEEGEET